jgi:hypothetical protein
MQINYDNLDFWGVSYGIMLLTRGSSSEPRCQPGRNHLVQRSPRHFDKGSHAATRPFSTVTFAATLPQDQKCRPPSPNEARKSPLCDIFR